MARGLTVGTEIELTSGFAPALFGREEERAQLLALIANHSVRLVSLTGRAGVGKTRLALEVTRALACNERHRTVVVSLAGVSDSALVMAEIAAAFSLPAVPNVAIEDVLTRRIGSDPVVLVIDNFEHVLAAASALGELLDHCPGVTVFVTSQSPLRLRHERVVELLPLPLPPLDDDDPLALFDEPAVALYCERAAAVDPHFSLTSANASAVAQLCARLEGLPLAITLVAARARSMPAAEVLARLDDTGLGLVRHPSPDAPSRHHDLSAAIDWTYRLLDARQQRLLRALSIVSGSFDVDAAAALDGGTVVDAMDTLSTLVDFHLVDPDPQAEPMRFTMPSTIRAFARTRLDDAGELDQVRGRYVVWRARQARASALDTEFLRGELAGAAARQHTHDDLLDGLGYALDLGLGDEALDLVSGLAPSWATLGYHFAHERLLEQALALAEEQQISTVAYVNAMSWSACLGLSNVVRTHRTVFIDRLRTAEARARELGDDEALLRALSFWLRVQSFTGDRAEAARGAAEGLCIAADPDHAHWLAPFLVWSGMLAHQELQPDRAVELGQEGLHAARRAGDLRTIVHATMLLRPLVTTHPEIADNIPRMAEALSLARATGLTRLEGALLPMLVVESIANSDETAAVLWCEEALLFARTIVDSPAVCYTFIAATALAAQRGDDATAAFFHGLVRNMLPVLAPTLPPENLESHERVVEHIEQTMGAAFAPAVERGAQTTWADGVEHALQYVRDAVPQSVTVDIVEPEPLSLTPRQHEVLELLASGLTNKEIASRLECSPKTVMHHTRGIYRTLSIRSRSEATAWAYRAGVVH